MRKRVCLSISPWMCFFLAAALLLLPVKWVISWTLASAMHEIAHIFALLILGGDIAGISLGPGGAVIKTGPLTNRQEFYVSLTGPACSFLLILLHQYIPTIAICGAVHFAFNLLPIHPLDGGRATLCILRHYLPEAAANKILHLLQRVCLLLILIVSAYLSAVLKFLLPLIVCAVLYGRVTAAKSPCK